MSKVKIVAKISGVEKTYHHYINLVMDINAIEHRYSSLSSGTLSSYFTPSKLKEWNIPQWLKKYIVSVTINHTVYSEQGSHDE